MLLLLLILSLKTIVNATTEFVALIPAGSSDSNVIQWVNVTYPENVSSANDVILNIVDTEIEQIPKAWYDLNIGNGAQLTGKVFQGEILYLLENDGNAPNQAGCCANLLTSVDAFGTSKTLKLDSLIQNALNVSDAYVSHTFDVSFLNNDDKKILAKKVLKLEHVLYPVCLKLFSDNLIEIDGEQIIYSKEAENLLYEINAIIPEQIY